MADNTNTTSAPDPEVLSSLINRPEIRAAMAQEVDSEIKALSARLEKLQTTRASLLSDGDVEPAASPRRAATRRSEPRKSQTNGKTNGRRGGGRPPGAGAGHIPAIFETLKGKTSGLTAGEIWDALVARKHPADKKTIMTYLTKLSSEKDGRLGVKGERGSYRYVVAKK